MVSELTSFFSRMDAQLAQERAGHSGLDYSDLGTDAEDVGQAGTAGNGIADYFGFNMESRRFLNQFSQMFGLEPAPGLANQAMKYGQNPMQQPGMQMAMAAPMQGAQFYFPRAPRVKETYVMGGEQGAGQPAPAAQSGTGPNINVNANVGGADGAEATSAEKLEDMVKAAGENAPEGYEPGDWNKIIDDAKVAAERKAENDGTEAANEFKHIMGEFGKVPSRDFTEKKDADGNVVGKTAEQQKADWAREFGKWRASNIGGVTDSRKTQRVVDDVAGADDKSFTLNHKRNRRLEKRGVRTFTVAGDASQYGLTDGQKIYYAKGDGKWFKGLSKDGLSGPIGGIKADGTQDEIKLGGGSDRLDVELKGVIEGKAEEGQPATIYDQFKLGAAHGEMAAAIRKEHGYIYRDGAGTLYTKKDDVYTDLPAQAKLEGGSFYFNEPGVPLDAEHADDVGAYMKAIDEEVGHNFARGMTMAGAERQAISKRLEAVAREFEAAIDEGGRGKLTFEHLPGNGIDINCNPKACEDVRAAMGFEPGEAGQQKNVNAILKNLPSDVDVHFNGETIEFSEKPLRELNAALQREMFKEVTVAGDEIDLSGKDHDAVMSELKDVIDANRDSEEIENIEKIAIDRPVILPKGYSATDADGKSTVDEGKVRILARQLSDKYSGVPVEFNNVGVSGEGDMDFSSIGVGGDHLWYTDSEASQVVSAFEKVQRPVQKRIDGHLKKIEDPKTERKDRLEEFKAFGESFREYRGAVRDFKQNFGDKHGSFAEVVSDGNKVLRGFNARYKATNPRIGNNDKPVKAEKKEGKKAEVEKKLQKEQVGKGWEDLANEPTASLPDATPTKAAPAAAPAPAPQPVPTPAPEQPTPPPAADPAAASAQSEPATQATRRKIDPDSWLPVPEKNEPAPAPAAPAPEPQPPAKQPATSLAQSAPATQSARGKIDLNSWLPVPEKDKPVPTPAAPAPKPKPAPKPEGEIKVVLDKAYAVSEEIDKVFGELRADVTHANVSQLRSAIKDLRSIISDLERLGRDPVNRSSMPRDSVLLYKNRLSMAKRTLKEANKDLKDKPVVATNEPAKGSTHESLEPLVGKDLEGKVGKTAITVGDGKRKNVYVSYAFDANNKIAAKAVAGTGWKTIKIGPKIYVISPENARQAGV